MTEEDIKEATKHLQRVADAHNRKVKLIKNILFFILAMLLLSIALFIQDNVLTGGAWPYLKLGSIVVFILVIICWELIKKI